MSDAGRTEDDQQPVRDEAASVSDPAGSEPVTDEVAQAPESTTEAPESTQPEAPAEAETATEPDAAPQAEAAAEPQAAAEAAADAEPTTAQPDTGPEPEAAPEPTPAAAAPRPPLPRPGPRPVPHPPARPQATAPTGPTAASATAPAAEEHPQRPASDPTRWGRVAVDGTVHVTDPAAEGGERAVGSFPDATPAEALAYFGRKYDDLVAQVDLAEARLAVPGTPVKDVARALRGVRGQLPEANVVGDLAGLAARLDELDAVVEQRRHEADAARSAAKEEARVAREALVVAAEQIAATDASRMQWKASGDQLQQLFEQWREAQRTGTRLDKPVEDALWKRFSHARTVFDRARKHHFAQLHVEHDEAKAAKEKLITEAEALSGSREWGPTTAAYRALMDRWKSAGRAGRKDDDALWARFRAAQDVFFEARAADQNKQDEEFGANLAVKEKLLVEAEALIPFTDLAATKARLRDLQDRWDAAGKVPRADMARIEKRLRTVEEAVRSREDEKWSRSNPETRARAEGALGQLEDSIAGLERDLEAARASGDSRAEKEAGAALAARRAWLDAVRRTADEHA